MVSEGCKGRLVGFGSSAHYTVLVLLMETEFTQKNHKASFQRKQQPLVTQSEIDTRQVPASGNTFSLICEYCINPNLKQAA